MKRRNFGRDRGLTLRMLATSGLLGLLYVGFAVVLLSALNVGLAPMLVIVVGLAVVQYWTSDKLALAASGAKIVSQEQAPELHAMVERLCAHGRPAEAADRGRRQRRAERVRNRPEPEARGRSQSRPASGAASSRRRSRACSRTSSRTSPTATC